MWYRLLRIVAGGVGPICPSSSTLTIFSMFLHHTTYNRDYSFHNSNRCPIVTGPEYSIF